MPRRSPPPHPRFPLADWIRRHAGLPHDLAQSGMRGELHSVAKLLEDPPPATPEELRGGLARLHRVPARRVFLTHGATEANSLVLLHLARRAPRRTGSPARARFRLPEYPPLLDSARFAGLDVVTTGARAEVAVLSNPGNPEGTLRTPEEVSDLAAGCQELLVDETFREFTDVPSLRHAGEARVWRTGSFTKSYGADDLRVGYVITPPDAEKEFLPASWLLDELPTRSVSGAVALLGGRTTVLGEARALFERNLRTLQAADPGAPRLASPVFFDRGTGSLDGDRLARRAARRGVLVCPGSLFGDPRGVRLCLTRSTFPRAYAAYSKVRGERA